MPRRTMVRAFVECIGPMTQPATTPPTTSSPSAPPGPPRRPNRHKMVFLTWVGIWPTITLVLLAVLQPLLAVFPLPIVTLIITALVVPLMGYVVMPFLTRTFGDWLHR